VPLGDFGGIALAAGDRKRVRQSAPQSRTPNTSPKIAISTRQLQRFVSHRKTSFRGAGQGPTQRKARAVFGIRGSGIIAFYALVAEQILSWESARTRRGRGRYAATHSASVP